MATPLPSLVLVTGPEELLAERAVASVVTQVREADPGFELVRLSPQTYSVGELAVQTSPSLFGGTKLVVVDRFEETTDELLDDVASYAAAPDPDVTLVVTHRAGQRGKKALDALKKSGARVLECPLVKEGEKASFATHELRRAGRKATPEAVRALVQAVGKDLRELAAACSQLVADTEGLVDEEVVERYHGGKVEATGFKVADAVVAGQRGEALALMRHAIATGRDPVPIVAVIALQLRQLVKVGSAGRGSSGALSRELGMAPFAIDRARRALQGWDGPSLGRAIQAIAAADHEVKGGGVKGGGRDPVYALERAILTIVALRPG